MQHLQYKSPRYNIKIAGLFAPAISTFIHRTTTHFISLFCYPHPYKNRSPQPITPPRFAPLYRTSSPLITVSTVLPWQMKSIFNIVFYLLVCSEILCFADIPEIINKLLFARQLPVNDKNSSKIKIVQFRFLLNITFPINIFYYDISYHFSCFACSFLICIRIRFSLPYKY